MASPNKFKALQAKFLEQSPDEKPDPLPSLKPKPDLSAKPVITPKPAVGTKPSIPTKKPIISPKASPAGDKPEKKPGISTAAVKSVTVNKEHIDKVEKECKELPKRGSTLKIAGVFTQNDTQGQNPSPKPKPIPVSRSTKPIKPPDKSLHRGSKYIPDSQKPKLKDIAASYKLGSNQNSINGDKSSATTRDQNGIVVKAADESKENEPGLSPEAVKQFNEIESVALSQIEAEKSVKDNNKTNISSDAENVKVIPPKFKFSQSHIEQSTAADTKENNNSEQSKEIQNAILKETDSEKEQTTSKAKPEEEINVNPIKNTPRKNKRYRMRQLPKEIGVPPKKPNKPPIYKLPVVEQEPSGSIFPLAKRKLPSPPNENDLSKENKKAVSPLPPIPSPNESSPALPPRNARTPLPPPPINKPLPVPPPHSDAPLPPVPASSMAPDDIADSDGEVYNEVDSPPASKVAKQRVSLISPMGEDEEDEIYEEVESAKHSPEKDFIIPPNESESEEEQFEEYDDSLAVTSADAVDDEIYEAFDEPEIDTEEVKKKEELRKQEKEEQQRKLKEEKEKKERELKEKEERERKEREKKEKEEKKRIEKEEKERLAKERKEKKEKERKEKELKTKFKFEGEEIVIHTGTVVFGTKGSKLDLDLKTGDVVWIIRMDHNPPGKWLAKTQDAKYGYVVSSNIDVDTNTIKSAMETAYGSMRKKANHLLSVVPNKEDANNKSNQSLNLTDGSLDQTTGEDIYEDTA
ncbi:unnamed protein product [Owenia fusiformis]|uniref:Uncharacterized protein n=1 Tax=Owenia fusiformis TaxID=6347 RepID=A0A8J1U8Y3_OWEFU|nr:unnamed protein product [Owenia fusiformis]